MPERKAGFEGMLFGLLGVLGFSFTLPATRLAVAGLDPVVVGLGRALVAACLAAPLLYATGQKWPNGRQWRSLFLVVAGVVVGFPLLSAWAMRLVPASHGAIVVGLLPLATAIAGAIRARERPSLGFWIASVCGSMAVAAYALDTGGGRLQPADLALLAAVALAALGYAEGACLAKELGGWQVICWALLLSVPLLVGPTALALWKHGFSPTPSSLAGFAYVSLISMFLAFFAWYRGLSTGGVARVSQLQLLQPFLTLGLSALFLGEHFGAGAAAAAAVVALSIVAGRRGKVTVLKADPL